MAGTIGLDQVFFVARIASMKKAAENINITAELVFDGRKGGCL